MVSAERLHHCAVHVLSMSCTYTSRALRATSISALGVFWARIRDVAWVHGRNFHLIMRFK
jgi:hypothetical protein